MNADCARLIYVIRSNSVRPSVTRRYLVKTAEHIVEVLFIRIALSAQFSKNKLYCYVTNRQNRALRSYVAL